MYTFRNWPQKFIQLEGCSLCKPSFIFQRIKAIEPWYQQDHFPSLLYHLTMCVFNSSFPVHSQLSFTPEIKGNWSQACSFIREMALKVRIEKPKAPSNQTIECRIGICSLAVAFVCCLRLFTSYIQPLSVGFLMESISFEFTHSEVITSRNQEVEGDLSYMDFSPLVDRVTNWYVIIYIYI